MTMKIKKKLLVSSFLTVLCFAKPGIGMQEGLESQPGWWDTGKLFVTSLVDPTGDIEKAFEAAATSISEKGIFQSLRDTTG